MSQEQRQQHIRKFNTCSVRAKHAMSASNSMSTTSQETLPSSISVAAPCQSPPSSSLSTDTTDMLQDITTGRFHIENQKPLSVSLNDAVQSVKLPFTTIEGIWKKAGMLAGEKNAVVPASGLGQGDKMVKSKSGSVPHMVTIDHGSLHYKCDDKCLQYKSANICSHTVAAAEVNGDLAKFLHFLRHKCAPNLMQMAIHGMPAGAGRKGGKAAKKKVPPKRAPTEENRVSLATCYSSPAPAPSCGYGSPAPAPSGSYGPLAPSCSYSPPAPSGGYGPPAPSGGYGPPAPYGGYGPPTPYGGYGSPAGGCGFPAPSQYPYSFNPPYQSSWAWPSAPPPWSLSSASQSNVPHTASNTPETFKVHLKTGNISVCSGCRNAFTQLDTVVLQHLEFRQFNSPRSGLPSSKYGNAYYHAKKRCMELKWGLNFTILIPENVVLASQQRDSLREEFGV